MWLHQEWFYHKLFQMLFLQLFTETFPDHHSPCSVERGQGEVRCPCNRAYCFEVVNRSRSRLTYQRLCSPILLSTCRALFCFGIFVVVRERSLSYQRSLFIDKNNCSSNQPQCMYILKNIYNKRFYLTMFLNKYTVFYVVSQLL